jgi:hypothetical protein
LTDVISGKEVLDNFFNRLDKIQDLDKKTVETIIGLYKEGKLTQKNLSNALSQLRDEEK